VNRAARFVDTGYWIAIAVVRDMLHDRAVALSRDFDGRLITTEAIVLELTDALAGVETRRLVVSLVDQMRRDPDLEIIPLDEDLYSKAWRLFTERMDKSWQLTDCISFVVMEERGIREALAYDQHFIQAGYRALLREA
jgi:predicted nucleic acid-binding protein